MGIKSIGETGLAYLWGKIKANFVSILGTSGNYLTWTKNGTTNNITVPYATKSGGVNITTTDNAVARYDGTSGVLQNSGVTINDSNLLYAPAARFANTIYGISFGRTHETPVETLIKTGIKWIHGKHMPVIHITGYAYGLQSPVEFKIGFYIYENKVGWCGVTNMGAWQPEVFLFKYTNSDNIDCVAVGLKGSCYFLQLQCDVQDEMGKFDNIFTEPRYWNWEFLTTAGTIPVADGGVTCIKVPYKADILSQTWSQITNKPTTISGYGITDAKIANGTITLGNNTITPLTSFTETDPTVPSWAKASSKPSYTASEVGAVPTTRKINGKALSADITLSASDVNALPSTTVIPD